MSHITIAMAATRHRTGCSVADRAPAASGLEGKDLLQISGPSADTGAGSYDPIASFELWRVGSVRSATESTAIVPLNQMRNVT